MTDSTPYSTTYSAFIPQIWSQKLSNMLEKNCVMMQCVNRNWEGEISQQGDKVKIITPADVEVSTLTGDSITYSSLTPTAKELVIDQKKFFAFKIDDVAKAQTNTDIMEAHLNNAKKAIEVVQDSYILSLHADVTASNTVGSEQSPVALDKSTIYSKFVELALALKNSDAIQTGVRPWVVINPDIEAYLLQSSEFISAHNVADTTLREGSIGRIAGMDVLVSTNLTEVDDKYYVLAGTNDAITFASQLAKIESLRDKDSFSDLVRGLYLYGAKTVQPKALAKMIVSASASGSTSSSSTTESPTEAPTEAPSTNP